VKNKNNSNDEINEQPFNITKVRKSRVVLVIVCFLALGLLFLLKPIFKGKKAQDKPKSSPIVEHHDDRIEIVANLPKSYADIKPKSENETESPKTDLTIIEPKKDEAPVDKEAPGKVVPRLIQKDTQSVHVLVKKPLKAIDDDEEKALKSDIMFKLKKAKKIDHVQEKSKGLKSSSAVSLNDRIKNPKSPYMIMAGSNLPAVLITGINSNLPGPVVAQIRSNIFDTTSGRFLLIPQGSKIIGRYDSRIARQQERVQVTWQRLIFSNGSSIELGTEGMPGADLEGYSGFKDKVNNHYGKLLSAILASTFLSVGAKYSSAEGEKQIAKDIAADISYDVNKAGQKIVNRQLNVAPTIEIKQGYTFNVLVTKDIILREYKPDGSF